MSSSPSLTSAAMRTIVASACLRTLVSASLTMRSSSTWTRGASVAGMPVDMRELDAQAGAVLEVVDGARQHVREGHVLGQAGAHRDERLARLHDGRVERLRDLGREGLVGLGQRARKPLELELGEPEVLGQPVVDLAGEARALLEGGAFGVVDAHAVEGGVGRTQGSQVAALVGDGAGHEDHVGHQAHHVRDGHEVGVDAGPEGVLDLGHEQDDEADGREGVAHRAAASPGHAVEDDGGQRARSRRPRRRRARGP